MSVTGSSAPPATSSGRTRVAFAPLTLGAVAGALGLSRPDVRGVRTRAGLELRPEGGWLAVVDPACGCAPADLLGAPGLWRALAEGEVAHDLPQLRGLAGDGQGGAASVGALAAFLDWAAATRPGNSGNPAGLDPAWRAPARSVVEEWIDPSRLRARAGSRAVRGELVCDDRRLAFVFPELARLPRGLAAGRRAWLDALLADAQRRWRLVRFGVAPGGSRVCAEVDLSGVPEAWARPLVQLSLDALAWAVEWVLSPVSFLADPGASSRALERASVIDSPDRSHTT